jgi:fumarate reductase flavoprotein subunit
VLSLVPPKRSHSKAAQGGMQASLGNVVKGQGDNEDVHFEDTVRGSDWGATRKWCACSSTPRPRRCASWPPGACPGAASARATARVIINGQKVTITERDEAHGLVAQRDFGGTKKWRTCYVSDGTGHAMLQAVGDRAIGDGIPVHERVEALALIHDGGAATARWCATSSPASWPPTSPRPPPSPPAAPAASTASRPMR